MSWRLLTFSLLIFAALATTVGLKLGDTLIDRVPNQANLPNTTVLDPEPLLDSEGKAKTIEPPQPLFNGELGMPKEREPIDWTIKVDEEKAKSNNNGFNPDADNITVTHGTTDSQQNFTPINRPNNTQQSSNNSGSNAAWISTFNQKMAQCRNMGFNERPACIRNTRQQYCGANNAWGKVADCPG